MESKSNQLECFSNLDGLQTNQYWFLFTQMNPMITGTKIVLITLDCVSAEHLKCLIQTKMKHENGS